MTRRATKAKPRSWVKWMILNSEGEPHPWVYQSREAVGEGGFRVTITEHVEIPARKRKGRKP